MSSPSQTPVAAWSAGARVAGTIVALGYLLGVVRGPVMAVVGGLALVTFARCLSAPAPEDAALAAALAVLAGAIGVGSLRWGVVDLGDLRGIQGVLGPTLLVGPAGAAAACWVATAGAVAALAAWLATAKSIDGDGPREVVGLWAAEALVGSLLVVSVFWGPSVPRGSLGGDALVAGLRWFVLTVAVAGAAGGGALVLARRRSWRWIALGAGATCAAMGAALVARVL